MPIIITRSIIALIGACFVFFNFTFNDIESMQVNVDGYFDTEDTIIFYTKAKVKDKTVPAEVIIDKEKNKGKIKITWRDKITEINIEHEGDISPENKEYIDKTIKAVTDYIENSQSLTQRTKNYVKNYLRNIGSKLVEKLN